MSTTAIPATIRYLITTFRAAATLGAAASPVRVFAGPEVTEEWAQLVLWVGMNDPDSGTAPTAATGTQDWAGMPARTRKEAFSIFCTAEAWSGDTDVLAAMDAAYGIVAAVEDLVRVDKYLGGNANVNPGVTNASLKWNNTEKGAVAKVQFEIGCESRIGA